MNLIDQIKTDLVDAQKSKNELELATLRLLISSIKNQEIENKKPLSDEEIIVVIRKEVKKRDDAISAYSSAGRKELADKEDQEMQILKKYLPAEIPDEELEQIISSVIEKTGATTGDFGKVMGQVMAQVGQKANGTKVAALVKKHLDE